MLQSQGRSPIPPVAFRKLNISDIFGVTYLVLRLNYGVVECYSLLLVSTFQR